jgi:hypothetical protein
MDPGRRTRRLLRSPFRGSAAVFAYGQGIEFIELRRFRAVAGLDR